MIGDDTIAAISSCAGPAARMIVRMSGPDAPAIAAALAPGADIVRFDRSCACRATIAFAGLEVPAWLYFFAAPHSYTGQHVVEFHIPGNVLLARMLLGELLGRGARQAEAGEFTARAYFSGRMNLDQAEGVAAVIAARGDEELAAARQLLAGQLAAAVRPVMDDLTDTLALVEAGIDFAEEDIAFLSPSALCERIAAARAMLDDLVRNSARFEQISHQPHFVLAGRPNAGKSTLLNVLSGRRRAVVSPVAGTTRDVIWAEALLDRGVVRISDAAGLLDVLPPEEDRSPAAQIARQMHNNAVRAVAEADFVLLVHDAADRAPPPALPRRHDLLVRSKADLLARRERDAVGADQSGVIAVSALTGWNIDALRRRMSEMAFGPVARHSARLALNARHLAHIAEAQTALARAMDSAGRGEGHELVALSLREALDALGAIVGRVTPDDLLQRIFATFCIGK